MPCLDEFQRLDGLIGIALAQFPWVQSLLHAQPIREVREASLTIARDQAFAFSMRPQNLNLFYGVLFDIN